MATICIEAQRVGLFMGMRPIIASARRYARRIGFVLMVGAVALVGTTHMVRAQAPTAAPAAPGPAGNGGFVDNGDGTISDTQTGMVWAQSDNGAVISWNDALKYCTKGMRLPRIDELQQLYDRPAGVATPCGTTRCRVSPLFKLSSNWFWSSTMEGSARALDVSYRSGNRFRVDANVIAKYRALCVR